MNAGASSPVFWGTSPGSPAEVLTNWPAGAKCGALRPHTNYLMALDYTDELANPFPQLIKWSDAAEPGTIPQEWAPAPSNQAGSVSCAATPGAVVDGLTLRQQFIVYKQSSTFSLDFIGGQFIFGLRLLFANIGALSRNCVVEFEGKHAVLSDGDFIVHGEVSGDCDISGTVSLADSGYWQGSIRADNVVVAGQIEGDITASGKVEITPSAKIAGTVTGEAIAVAEGAVVEGVMKTTGKAEPLEFVEKRDS